MHKSIGFVSGCFDWLTPGHVRLFKEARKHCDKLYMLMADDVTVQHYKGPTRPLLCLEERIELACACRYINGVYILHKTPERSNQFELIKKLNANYYYEGADATDVEIGAILDELGIQRVTLSTKPLHVTQILDRHFARFDPHDAHRALIEVAGL